MSNLGILTNLPGLYRGFPGWMCDEWDNLKFPMMISRIPTYIPCLISWVKGDFTYVQSGRKSCWCLLHKYHNTYYIFIIIYNIYIYIYYRNLYIYREIKQYDITKHNLTIISIAYSTNSMIWLNNKRPPTWTTSYRYASPPRRGTEGPLPSDGSMPGPSFQRCVEVKAQRFRHRRFQKASEKEYRSILLFG